MNPVILVGVTPVSHLALDIIQQNGGIVYGFLEEGVDLQGNTLYDIPVLGSITNQQYLSLLGPTCEVYVALQKLSDTLSFVDNLYKTYKLTPLNIIHPSAQISPLANIGEGNLCAAQVVIEAGASLHQLCVLHAGVIIGVEAQLKKGVHVGAGTIIGAHVVIEEEVMIGAGAIITPGTYIGKGAKIAPGTVVIADVTPEQYVEGNPAKPISL